MEPKVILIIVLQFLLSISILVVLHELGHFLMAKLFKTRVEKFYMFFNPWFSLFKKKIGETEYGIGWLPLGGYVKISGMIDESMDKRFIGREPKPWEFRSKPAWQRLLIMLGGVIMNILVAIVIYIAVVYTWGETKILMNSLKDGVWVQNSVLKDAGMKNGDKILALDGQPVKYFEDLIKPPTPPILTAHHITVERNGQTVTVNLPEDLIKRLVDAKKKQGLLSPRYPFIINKVIKTSPNKDVDLKKGDEVVSVDGHPVAYMDEVLDYFDKHKGQTVTLGIKRGTDTLRRTVHVGTNGKIGVETYLDENVIKQRHLYKTVSTQYSLWQSVPRGLSLAAHTLGGYLQQLKIIFNPSTDAYKSVGGFISFAKIFPPVWDWHAFWRITAFISIMLAVLNILPIPALDGGHAMFVLYEMVTGRKPSDRFLEKAQIVGFVLLLTLLVLANGNDILRLLHK